MEIVPAGISYYLLCFYSHMMFCYCVLFAVVGAFDLHAIQCHRDSTCCYLLLFSYVAKLPCCYVVVSLLLSWRLLCAVQKHRDKISCCFLLLCLICFFGHQGVWFEVMEAVVLLVQEVMSSWFAVIVKLLSCCYDVRFMMCIMCDSMSWRQLAAGAVISAGVGTSSHLRLFIVPSI